MYYVSIAIFGSGKDLSFACLTEDMIATIIYAIKNSYGAKHKIVAKGYLNGNLVKHGLFNSDGVWESIPEGYVNEQQWNKKQFG